MKQIRAILVGCGGMSSAWLSAASKIEDLDIVGLVDLNVGNMERQAKEFKLRVSQNQNLESLLADLKPDIVFDCTTPGAHKTVTLSALKAGCHVLGEKPIADNLEDAKEMVKAAKDAEKLYAVIQNRRYAQAIRTVRKSILDGVIGKVHTINADFYLGPHFGGFREEMEHVLLVDMAIHSFDQARFIGNSNPNTVYCHEYNPESSWFRHGASAMGIFEMSDGSVFNYRGSWCAEGLPTSWQCSWRIIGEKGTLLWDGEDAIQIEIAEKAEAGLIYPVQTIEVVPEQWDTNDDGHEGLIREFVRCLQTGEQPMTIGCDNIHSLDMVFGAIESAETGQKINIQL